MRTGPAMGFRSKLSSVLTSNFVHQSPQYLHIMHMSILRDVSDSLLYLLWVLMTAFK